MEAILDKFASPAFSGFMLLAIVGLLYQIAQELQGIRAQLKSRFEQEDRWRQ